MPQRAGLPKVEVRERTRSDPSFLDLDPDTIDPARHYRWVRCRSDEHMMAITKTKLAGYRIEKSNTEGGVRALTETEQRPDHVIAVGDLVLMSCPLSHFEQRELDSHNKVETMLASATAQTEQMAKEKGISIIKDADHST